MPSRRLFEDDEVMAECADERFELEMHHASSVLALEERIEQATAEARLASRLHAVDILSQDEHEFVRAELSEQAVCAFMEGIADTFEHETQVLEEMIEQATAEARLASRLHAVDILSQDEHEFARAELSEQAVCAFMEGTADTFEHETQVLEEMIEQATAEARLASRLHAVDILSQDEHELTLAERIPRVGGTELNALDEPRGEFCDLAFELAASLEKSRTEFLEIQDELESERHAFDAGVWRIRARAARRQVDNRIKALQRRLQTTRQQCAILEAQLSEMRSSIAARIQHVLHEQRMELGEGFKARSEWAARQRIAREAAARRKEAIAAQRGTTRGAIVTDELTRMAPRNALL
jgi:predicted RNA-binding protein Jag